MPTFPTELVALPNGGTVDRRRLICSTVTDGNPKAWERTTRSESGRVYTPAKTLQAERDLGWRTKEQNEIGEPVSSPVVLDVVFYMKVGRNLGAKAGGSRADLDNMIKLVKDGLSGIAYVDDHLVEKIVARVIRGDPSPRTEFVVYLDE